jgi:hypothetical protein
MTKPVFVDVMTLERVLDAMLMADHASGYCTCGARVVAHRTKDHKPVDDGEQKAEKDIVDLKKIIADLRP